jgi:hypothetical protein
LSSLSFLCLDRIYRICLIVGFLSFLLPAIASSSEAGGEETEKIAIRLSAEDYFACLGCLYLRLTSTPDGPKLISRPMSFSKPLR